MPLKSRKQVAKMFVLEREGQLPPGKAEQMARETPNISALPERLTKPKRKPRKRRL